MVMFNSVFQRCEQSSSFGHGVTLMLFLINQNKNGFIYEQFRICIWLNGTVINGYHKLQKLPQG